MAAALAQGDFPFLFVQLPPYSGNTPELRDAQLHTLKTVPNTAMVVTTDPGDPTNVHPSHKGPVGERLALAARALVYGEKIESSGPPLFDSAEMTGDHAVLHFTHLGTGLMAKDDPLKGFEIAGSDKKFWPAQAAIQNGTVIVSSANVPLPAYIRYGWSATPDVNFYNHEGLPASPFTTETN